MSRWHLALRTLVLSGLENCAGGGVLGRGELAELEKYTEAACIVQNGVLIVSRGPVRVDVVLAEYGITAVTDDAGDDNDEVLIGDEDPEEDLWSEETDNDRG